MAITFDGAPSAQSLGNYGQRLLPLLSNQQDIQQPVDQTTQQPAQPVQQPTANDTINQAVANGAQQAATQHAQAQSISNAVQRGARLQSGLMGGLPQNNPVAMEFMQGLLGYKDQYDTAAKTGDQQGMADAAAGANVLRQYAQRAGVNLDDYYAGANNTRAQLAAAINAQNDLNFGSLLNSPDSATYYDNVYQQALNNGASRRVAARYAGQQAQKYQAQRMADLSLALQDRGVSHQGFLNKTGAQILAMMYDENPNGVAQVYNQYFGKPVNLGTWELAELSQDSADKRQRGQMTLTEQLQELFNNKSTDNALRLQQPQIDLQRYITDKTYQAKIDALNTQERMNAENNATKVQVAQYGSKATGSKTSGNSGSSSSSSSNSTKGISTALSVAKAYNDWAKDNPDEPSYKNPYAPGNDKALEIINGYGSSPQDVDDYQGMYSWAQDVLEENARRDYPATAEQLAQAISSVGGYGPQIAQELADDGSLSKYGR